MGASPDGLVTDPSERQHMVWLKSNALLVQRKSYYWISALKNSTSRSFFLQYSHGKYQLKKGHNYYYQIQGQLQITCRQWCLVVVWTPVATVDDLIVQRIYSDKDVWNNIIYLRLYRFYMGSLLPELANPCHVSGQPVREVAPFWNDDDLQPSHSVQSS